MKRLFIIFAMIAVAVSCFANDAKVGSSGAQFLKIGVGSRYQAMGEASAAVANDVYSMYWNPAGLADVENTGVSFTNVNWVLDIDLNHVALAQRVEGVGVFGASVTVLSMGEQEVTRADAPDGTNELFDAGSFAVGISYARYLTHKFAFGGSFKYIGERIYREESSGYAFDFGTILHTGFRSLRLGMSISNMGPELQFSGPEVEYSDPSGTDGNDPFVAQLKSTPYDLPLVFRIGVAYDINFGPKSLVTVSTEMKHPSDNEQQGAIGLEYGFDEQFFLRGGYKLNYDEETFTLGAGLNTELGKATILSIDYAWQDFGRLEATQRFSVGFTF